MTEGLDLFGNIKPNITPTNTVADEYDAQFNWPQPIQVDKPLDYSKSINKFNESIPFEENVGAVFEPYGGVKPIDKKLTEFDLQDIPEARAQAQNGNFGGRANTLITKGIPRIVTTAVSEVLKSGPEIYGAADWAINGFNYEDFSEKINNSWVQAIDNNLQKINEEYLPVYKRKVVENGGLLRQIVSPEFWATEGSAGAGMLVGFMLPGQMIKAVGIGSKMSKINGLSVKASKFIAKNADDAIAGTTNTIVEAVSEGIEATEATKAALYDKKVKSLMATGQYNQQEASDLAAQYLETPEAKTIIGKAGANTTAANMAILLGPNILDQKWLFNGFNRAGKASKDINKKLFQTVEGLGVEGAKQVGKYTSRQLAKEGLTKAGIGIGKEGFFEEGTQFATSEYFKNRALGQDDRGVVGGILGTYMESLSDTDMQKSIFLGSVLGGGMGSIGAVIGKKLEDKLLYGDSKKGTVGLSELFKNNFVNRYKTVSDLTEKDENGNSIYNEDGSPKIDLAKAKTWGSNIVNDEINKQMLEYYNSLGLTNPFDFAKMVHDFNYMMPFFQQEGGKEMLLQHINNLAEKDATYLKETLGIEPQSVQQIRQELLNKADKFEDIYYRVAQAHKIPNVEVENKDVKTFDEFNKSILDTKLSNELSQIFVADKIEETDREIQTLSSKANRTSLEETKLQKSIKAKEAFMENLEDLKKEAKELNNSNSIRESWKEYKNNLNETKKDIIDEVINAAETPGEVRDITEIVNAPKFKETLPFEEIEELNKKLLNQEKIVAKLSNTAEVNDATQKGFDWSKVVDPSIVPPEESTPKTIKFGKAVTPSKEQMQEGFIPPPITEVPGEIAAQIAKEKGFMESPSTKTATEVFKTDEAVPRTEEKFLEEEKKGNKTLEDKNNPFKDRVSTTLSVAYRAKEGDVVNGRTQDRLDQDGNMILLDDFNHQILEEDYLQKGSKLFFKVDTANEFYEANKNDINNIPIIITDESGNKVGYVHEIKWLNKRFQNGQIDEEVYNSLLEKTTKVRNNFSTTFKNRKLHIYQAYQAGLDRNMEEVVSNINAKYDAELLEDIFESTVESKSAGWLNQNFKKPRTIKEAFSENGVYDDTVAIRTIALTDNKNFSGDVANPELLNNSNLKGVAVVLVPGNNGQHIAKRLKQFTVKESAFGKEAIHNVMGILLNAVTDKTVSRAQLREELNKYIFATNYGGQELKSIISGGNQDLLFNVDLFDAATKNNPRNVTITIHEKGDKKPYAKYKFIEIGGKVRIQKLKFIPNINDIKVGASITFDPGSFGRVEDILFNALGNKYLNVHSSSAVNPKEFSRLVADENYQTTKTTEDYRNYLSDNNIVTTFVYGVTTNTGKKVYATQPNLEYNENLNKPNQEAPEQHIIETAPVEAITPKKRGRKPKTKVSEDNLVFKDMAVNNIPLVDLSSILPEDFNDLPEDLDFAQTRNISAFSLLTSLQHENDLVASAVNYYVELLNKFKGDSVKALQQIETYYREINSKAIEGTLSMDKSMNYQIAIISSLLVNNFEKITNPDGTTKFIGYKNLILLNAEQLKFNPLEEDYSSEDENEGKSAEAFDNDKNFKADPEKSASARVKRALFFIPEYENGQIKRNIIGQPVYKDYYKVFNAIINATADVPITEIVNELKSLDNTLKDKEPNNLYKQVLEILAKHTTNDTLVDEFHTVFTKQMVLMQKLIIYPGKKGELPTNRFYLSNKSGAAGLMVDQWKESHKKSELVNKDGSYNQSLLKKLKANNIEISKILKKSDYVEKMSDLLNSIGFKVSEEALIKLSDDYVKKPKRNPLFTKKGDRSFTTFRADFKNQITYILDSIDRLKRIDDEREDGSTKTIFTEQPKQLSLLAKYEAIVNPESLSHSFRNGNGDIIYGFVNPHFLSNTIYEIKNDLNNHKRSDSFSKKATWDKTEESKGILELNYFDAAVNGKTDKDAVEFEAMSPIEKEQFKAAAVLGNTAVSDNTLTSLFLTATPSDKTTFALIRAIKKQISKEDLTTKGKLSVDSSIVDELYDLLVQSELDRINQTALLFREAKKTDNWDNLIKGEHYSVINGKKVLGAGAYFFLIPEMNNVFKSWLNSLDNIDTDLAVFGETMTNVAKQALVAHINKLAETKYNSWNELGMFNRIDRSYNVSILNKLYNQAEREATPDIVNRYTVMDYIINNAISYANQMMLITGDPSTFVKPNKSWDGTHDTWDSMVDGTIINMFKRTAKDIAPGYEGLFDESEKNYNVLFVDEPKKSANIYTEYEGALKEKLSKLTDIEFFDAQKLTSLKEHVVILAAIGRITREQKNTILEKYKSNQDLTDEELGLVLQPLKPVEVGRENSGKFPINYYIKSSSYPLIPQLTKGLQIDALRRFMETNNIDAIVPNTAVKNGFHKPVTIFKDDALLIDEDGNLVPENFDATEGELSLSSSIHVLSREYFRIQQDVPFDPNKSKILEGSQLKKLKYSDLDISMDFYLDGAKYKGEQLKALDDEIHIEIYKRHYEELAQKLKATYLKDAELYVADDITELKKVIIEEALTRGFDYNDVMLLENLLTGTASQLPLFMHPALPKVEALLNSLIKNRVLVTKFPGKSYVQGSSMGFEKGLYGTEEVIKNVLEKTGIVLTSEFNQEKGLNYVVKKNSQGEDYVEAQVFLPWIFKEDIESFVTPIGTLDTTKIDSKLLELIGYRIPTQDHGSMVILKPVGFLPKSSGDLIIVPPQMSKLMGSDFDVDKLFVHRFNYVAENGRLNYIKPSSKIMSELSMEELQNLSLDITHSILQNAEVAARLLTPLDNNDIQEVLNTLKTLKPKVETSAEIVTDESKPSQTGLIYDGLHSSFVDINAAGQIGVGIGSIASTSHVLAQYSGIYLKKIYLPEGGVIDEAVLFTDKKGNKPFTDHKGKTQVQQNSVTSDKKYKNAVSKGLFRLDRIFGVTGKRISQVIKNIQTEAVDNAKNQRLFGMNLNKHTFNTAMFLAKAGLDEKYLGFFLNQPIMLDYVRELNSTSDIGSSEFKFNQQEEIQNKLFKQYGGELKGPFLLSLEELEDNLKGNIDANFQSKVLASFVTYTQKANGLSNLFRSINTDTKYLEKDITSTIKKRQDHGKYFYLQSTFGNTEGLENTLQKEAYRLGVDGSLMLYKNLVPYNTLTMIGIRSKLNSISDKEDGLNANDLDVLNKAIKNAIWVKAWTDAFNVDVNEYRNKLLFGENSLANRLIAAKEITNNTLIQLLLPSTSNDVKTPHTIEFPTAGSLEESFTLRMQQSFLALYNDKKTKKLAEDLVGYIITNGNERGARDFARFLPIDLYHKMGLLSSVTSAYAEVMKEYTSEEELNESIGTGALSLFASRFIQQYLQHNPSKASKADRASFKLTDKEKIADKATLEVKDLVETPELGYKDYIFLYEDGIHLYKREGNIFTKLPLLGNKKKFITEYDLSVDFKESLFKDNNKNITDRVPLEKKKTTVKTTTTQETPSTGITTLNKYGFTDGQNLKTVLENIINNSNNKGYSELAKILLSKYDKLKDITLVASMPEGVDVVGRFYNKERRLHVNPKKIVNLTKDNNRGEMSADEFFELVLLHETIHGLVSKEITNNPNSEFVQNMNKVFEQWKSNNKNSNLVYFEKNLQEFVSGLFTEERLQRDLANMKGFGDKNLLEQIWDYIIKLLVGNVEIKEDSLLMDALKAGLDLFNVTEKQATPEFTTSVKKSIFGNMVKNPNISAEEGTSDEDINDLVDLSGVKEGVDFVFEQNPELSNEVYEALGFNFRYTSEKWKDNPTLENKATYINIKGTPSNQEFQVKKDIEEGFYSVHFKTEQGKLTKEQIQTLVDAVASQIPIGGKLSTWGEITKGGISGLNRFLNNGFKKVGEREIKDREGRPIVVPILEKVEKSNLEQQAQQLYSQYLDTIFPDSKVKDIVYHHSSQKLEKFDKSFLGKETSAADTQLGFFFAEDKNDIPKMVAEKNKQLEELGLERRLNFSIQNNVLLNIKNPEYYYGFIEEAVSNVLGREARVTGKTAMQDYKEARLKLEKNNKDSLIYGLTVEPDGEVGADVTKGYVVFEPEQIHILGSKQDIEGFKEFMKSKQNVLSLPMSKTRKDLIDNIDLYKDFLGDMTVEDITNADNKTLTEILKKICK